MFSQPARWGVDVLQTIPTGSAPFQAGTLRTMTVRMGIQIVIIRTLIYL
ncbi:MAG: hypothetical protein LBC77_06100 [Spirochaetaceae bacterium]|nr:hypothetical protein [Spirochaetaceae bacterium]